MSKIAIITGSSRGIGAATAQLLASEGYAICVNYRNNAKAATQIVNDITKNNGKAIAVQADIGKEDDILRLFTKVDEELGPVTALINNAGINGGICLVEKINAECLESVFQTNVFGTFYCSREAVKRMRIQGGGAIINVSSEAAKFGGNKIAHYAASKAAINAFTLGFAREVAEYNIRVNTISPGVIDTEIHRQSSVERLKTLVDSLPMKRMGTVDEVAKLIHWLISDSSSYISGAIIPITGSR